ncbi:MAG: hypothetical protein IKY94_05415 [Lachnospiraceae bacterium]|nr:hypothetical protein [Lachnospiraceae bacterium]
MEKSIKEIIAEGGVICELCGQRMLKADGCTCSEIKSNGKIYKRIKFGEDPLDIDERCHDCHTSIGHYHHINCDAETCPVCGEQLISCDCDIEFIENK